MTTDDLESRVGRRVRDLREGRSWTQEELAGRMTEVGGVRIYQSTVAKIEKAGRPLRVNELEVLAAVFETSMGDLVEQSSRSPRDIAIEIVERRRSELRTAVDRLEAAQTAAIRAQHMLDVAGLKLQTAEQTLGQLAREGDGVGWDAAAKWWRRGREGTSDGEPGPEA